MTVGGSEEQIMAERVLVIGGGGREHALAWALARSAQVEQLYVAPGNAGTARIATNLPIPAGEIPALLAAAQEQRIDLTIVGPETPLATGITDVFNLAGLAAFGPSQAAARLESSKAFAKAFMQEVGIPTAQAQTFTDFSAATDYLYAGEFTGGVVIKASGLAAGKGVIVCDTLAEAEAALNAIMVGRQFGAAGNEVLVEERLQGPEVSVLAFSDGHTVRTMPPARDHKRVYDQDQGPNTGGMGAFAPPPDLPPNFAETIRETVLEPVVKGLAERGHPYVGVLYAGLMLTPAGPRVLEFNCRFGDPETQVILPLLETDLVEIAHACLAGNLDQVQLAIRPGACATVVMAAPGYPGAYPRGLPIHGVDQAGQLPDVMVFQAGTKEEHGQLVTNGGRVLAVSALGPDLPAAVNRAYAGVEKIQFTGVHYRRDIGR
jgi:phosphoribosylamine--glycine ligase